MVNAQTWEVSPLPLPPPQKKIQSSHLIKGFGNKSSSETQGQIVGTRESLNRRENMAQKKSKEQPEVPLGTMSYQTSSKRSPPFWLLIGVRKTQVFWHQSEAKTAATVWDGGVDVGSMWGRCGVNVGSMWGRCRVDVGSMWGLCRVDVGSMWGRCGVDVGSM